VSRYEGLNLPELLALMNDIVRPEPVSWAPQTAGWLVVVAWLAVVVVFVTWSRLQTWRRRRYRREALTLLETIEKRGSQDPAEMAQQLASILKRAALAAYSRSEVAALHGDEWATFLRRSAGNDPVVAQAAADLARAAYAPDADGRRLLEPARRWIEVHRA